MQELRCKKKKKTDFELSPDYYKTQDKNIMPSIKII